MLNITPNYPRVRTHSGLLIRGISLVNTHFITRCESGLDDLTGLSQSRRLCASVIPPFPLPHFATTLSSVFLMNLPHRKSAVLGRCSVSFASRTSRQRTTLQRRSVRGIPRNQPEGQIIQISDTRVRRGLGWGNHPRDGRVCSRRGKDSPLWTAVCLQPAMERESK